MSRHTLLHGFLWQLSGAWGTRLGSLAVFAVLARLLGPAELGAVNYVLGVLAIVLVLADLAMAEYLIYRPEATAAFATAIWWAQVLGSVALALALTVLNWLAPTLLMPTELDPRLLVAAAWSMPLLAAGKVPEALLRREPAGFRSLALRSLLVMLVGAAVAIPLAWLGWGAWSLIAKHWVEAAFGLLLYFRKGAWRPSGRVERTALERVLAGSWGLMGSRVLDILAQRLDVLLIGRWFGMYELGVYGVAQKLFQVLQGTLTGSVYGVVNSRLGALRGDPTGRLRFLKLSLTAASLVTVLVYLLALAFGGALVAVVFGAKWQPAVPLLQVFFGVAVVASLTQVYLAPYVTLARQDNAWVLGLVVVDMSATIAAIWVARPWGVLGVTWAVTLKTLAMGIVWWWRARTHEPLSMADALRALLPALCMVACAGGAWAIWTMVVPTAWPAWWAHVALLLGLVLGLVAVWSRFKPLLLEVRQEFHR